MAEAEGENKLNQPATINLTESVSDAVTSLVTPAATAVSEVISSGQEAATAGLGQATAGLGQAATETATSLTSAVSQTAKEAATAVTSAVSQTAKQAATTATAVVSQAAPKLKPKIAASPAPAPAAPPKKRLIPIPKDSATFFNARAKDIKAFQFNSDGNLAVPEMRGEPAKVIELPFYRDATIDEKREKEEQIKDELVAIEKEYDETASLLRQAMEVWRTTGAATEVLKYQRDLSRLDAQRTITRSPLRWVKTFGNPAIRDILLENVYEQRKMGYPVSAMILRSMTFSESVRPGEKPVAPSASVADQAEAVSVSGANAYIVFFDPADQEYGILSPETMVDFVFNSTKYTSLLQAYEVERVTAIGRKDLRPVLLKQVNPKQIRTMASRVVGKLENAREIWIQILKSATSQDPRFKILLQLTGDDIIVYADPRDTVLGVGLPAEDPAITDRTQWKGENMLGEAWQAVRSSLAEIEQLPTTDSYTEHGKTQEELKAERTKVFRGGYYRRPKA
jgi:predicted NAD-dependent protein-ADP-ribosyltransferase YbiA (DUF1768 family)